MRVGSLSGVVSICLSSISVCGFIDGVDCVGVML